MQIIIWRDWPFALANNQPEGPALRMIICHPRHPSLEKAPRLSIRIDIRILLSDTICQLIQFYTNSEAAMLSTQKDRPLDVRPAIA